TNWNWICHSKIYIGKWTKTDSTSSRLQQPIQKKQSHLTYTIATHLTACLFVKPWLINLSSLQPIHNSIITRSSMYGKLLKLLPYHKHDCRCPRTTTMLISRTNPEIDISSWLKTILIGFERARCGLYFLPYRNVIGS